jgi:hypothetical protein
LTAEAGKQDGVNFSSGRPSRLPLQGHSLRFDAPVCPQRAPDFHLPLRELPLLIPGTHLLLAFCGSMTSRLLKDIFLKLPRSSPENRLPLQIFGANRASDRWD